MIIGFICFKFLKFHYISSNDSISDYDTQANELLEKYGDDPIVGITIIKKQLSIPTLFLITFAQLPNISPDNLSNLLKMYHTSMVFHIKSNNKFDQHIFIEKNNKISISQSYSIHHKDKLFSIPLPKDHDLTLNGILERTETLMGQKQFFNWNNFYTNNCQTFTLSIIKSAELLDKKTNKFIKDDLQIVFNDFTLYLFNLAMYVASVFDSNH